MIDFPNAPTVDQTFGNYKWDGEKWLQVTVAAGTPVASNAYPLPAGSASAGTASPYAREDHVHPATGGAVGPTGPTGPAGPVGPTGPAGTGGSDSVLPATEAPLMDSLAMVGASTKYAREDHIHPSDTVKAPVVSPVFTGTPTAPTAAPATNTLQIATTAFVTTAVATATATVTGPRPPSGRLTLTSNTPVMTVNVSAASTLYWAPYLGAQVPFYDGTTWTTQTVGQISIATTDTTKNPAAIGISKVNDWFLWNDAGTVRLSHGPNWTNDTTRSVGLVMQDGIWLNSAAIINACAARCGTYVGTTRSEADSTLCWTSSDTASLLRADVSPQAFVFPPRLYIWNMYNRVTVSSLRVESVTSWSYNSSVPRALNNSNDNRISFVSGLAEDGITATLFLRVICPAAASGGIGISLDSTSSFTGARAFLGANSASVASDSNVTCDAIFSPQAGAHYLQAIESASSTAVTFNTGTNHAFVAVFRM
jgi:hypothetical protein